MNEDRKRPGVAFGATIVLAASALYVLSFGPAWWMASREMLPAKDIAHAVYRPLLWAVVNYKGPLRWWADLGAKPRGRRMELEYWVIWLDVDIPYQPGPRNPGDMD